MFETDGKFETFRRVLYFNTKSFARSFVYNEGYLYIGLGGNGRIDNVGDSVGSPYSGTLYRIDLEELVPGTPEEGKTETPSTSEATTEEKSETPSTSKATTEEKPETPSTSEVTTEEKGETPSTSEGTTEEKGETPSTSEGTTEESSKEEKPETPEVGKQTGWVQVGTKWYYLNADGTKKTGWVKDGKQWYYLNADGSMKTGWVKDGSQW